LISKGLLRGGPFVISVRSGGAMLVLCLGGPACSTNTL